MVKRLVLSRETTDEAVGMLAQRFPAVVSLEIKWKSGEGGWGVLTDQGMLAASNLTCCPELTDQGMRVVQPACAHLAQPQLLLQDHERGAARAARPYCAHRAQLELVQRHGRGASRAHLPGRAQHASPPTLLYHQGGAGRAEGCHPRPHHSLP
jgi:hypothetical protein